MAENNGTDYGMGSTNNMLWPLLALFSRGYGAWGDSRGVGCGSMACCDAITPKDVSHQLTAFQTWASENGALLQTAISGVDKNICCSTRDILAAVNALTPQMYQSFSTLTQGMDHGFAAQQLTSCQSTAAIQSALSDGFAAASRQGCAETNQLSTQMATGFTANALSSQRDTLETRNALDHNINRVETAQQTIYNQLQAQADRIALQASIQGQAQNNALNIQLLTNANAAAMAACDLKSTLAACCCEIKNTVKDDGQLTRSLINDQEVSRLRAQLNDTKELLSNANQSILINQQLKEAVGTIIHHCPRPCAPVVETE